MSPSAAAAVPLQEALKVKPDAMSRRRHVVAEEHDAQAVAAIHDGRGRLMVKLLTARVVTASSSPALSSDLDEVLELRGRRRVGANDVDRDADRRRSRSCCSRRPRCSAVIVPEMVTSAETGGLIHSTALVLVIG